MTNDRFERLLGDLRDRALRERGASTASSTDALERALHEIDVYHAELVIQNQDLLETQEALVTTRNAYRQLFEEAPTPILSISHQGIVLDVNRAGEALLGREHGVLCGHPLALRLAEGSAQPFFQHLAALRESSAPQSVELCMRSEGDKRSIVVMRSAMVGRTEPGTVLCHLTDVSEQRAATAAKETLAKRLREAEKLEAIGRVAANIAHDVNNLLVSVISLGEYARAAVEAPTGLSRDLDELIEGAWRGARLMRGLLGLSRGTVGQFRAFDVARSVASVVSMLKYKKHGVSVTLDAPLASPAMILGDEDEMTQALLNVGTNAIEAMASGELLVSFRVLEPRMLGGPRLARVTFLDEGEGMTEEQCSRIFEPLYTTKASSGGSGLGLTLVHKTVTSHHGTIDVESRRGEGTRVILELPLTTETTMPTRGSTSTSESLSGTYLLVDDDERARFATQRQLASAGAEVRAFPDGLSAYAAVEAGLEFKAAVVDVNMPGWSGPELVEHLVERLGPVPVVLVTGASGEIVPERLFAGGHVTLVRKPWTREEIIDALRDVVSAVSVTKLRST